MSNSNISEYIQNTLCAKDQKKTPADFQIDTGIALPVFLIY